MAFVHRSSFFPPRVLASVLLAAIICVAGASVRGHVDGAPAPGPVPVADAAADGAWAVRPARLQWRHARSLIAGKSDGPDEAVLILAGYAAIGFSSAAAHGEYAVAAGAQSHLAMRTRNPRDPPSA